MRKPWLACLTLAAALSLSALSGCSKSSEAPDFSGYTEIAELATVECAFHNDYCSAFATPFHAPLLQRSMADCHTLTI